MDNNVNAKKIELQNQKNIIACLENARMSRADIAKQTGLSRTTLSNACAHLLKLKLIRECSQEEGPFGRGRPGIPLMLTEDVWFAAGATLIDRELIFVVLSLGGAIVEQFMLPLADGSVEVFLTGLANGFERIQARYQKHLLPCFGIGSPGMINEGRILHASDMGWDNVNIAGYLYEKLHLPSEVINRHWASCISEYRLSHASSMIYVGISTGIAAAIIVDGKLFTGAYHSAGEIGHTVVKPGGPVCSCGRRGCLHSVASEVFILKHIQEYYAAAPGPAMQEDPLWEILAGGGTMNIEQVCRAADIDHPVAVRELREAALYLGLSISNLTSMFNPECVVLGGSLIDHGGNSFYHQILDSIYTHSSSDTLRSVRFFSWTQGRISGAIGAARLILDKKIELAGRGIL